MNETQSIEFVVSYEARNEYTDEATWLVDLNSAYDLHQTSGWNLVNVLSRGIKDLSKRKDKTLLYQHANDQIPRLSIKRMQNLVSLSRKPYCEDAQYLGLEIAHVEAVLGLPDDEALALLTEAAENGQNASTVGAIVSELRRQNVAVPDNGNQRPINDDMQDNNLNDVPFDNTKSNVLYENADDYSAEASAYAGDVAGYDWADDSLELMPSEFADLLERAAGNLRQHIKLGNSWCTTRSQRDWLKALEGLMY